MDTIASESMDVNYADKEKLLQHDQAVIDSISLDAETFTHPVPAYQILVGQGNDNAERMPNLVHTTQSMQRAKDVITATPSTAGDDIDYEAGRSEEFFSDDSEEESLDIGGKVGSSSRSGMPSWAFLKECDEHHFKTTLIQLISQTQYALQSTTNASTKKLLQAHFASLQLQ